MKIQFYLIFIAFIFISSCKFQEIKNKRITGTYQTNIKYSKAAMTITIHENNLFTYEWSAGLSYGTTTGTWKRVSNKLILNSDQQPKKRYFKITEEAKTDEEIIKIKVLDETKDYLIGASCMLMKDSIEIDGSTTDLNGICKLPYSKDANKIIISYTSLKTAIFSPDSLNSNCVTVELKPSGYYEYFTNREWKIRGRKIIAPERRRKLFSRDHYFKKLKK